MYMNGQQKIARNLAMTEEFAEAGSYAYSGSDSPAADRLRSYDEGSYASGFRVVLYK